MRRHETEPTYSHNVSAHGTYSQCVELAWCCMKYSSLFVIAGQGVADRAEACSDMRHANARGERECSSSRSVNQVTASFRFTVEARACSVAARVCVRLSTRVTAKNAHSRHELSGTRPLRAPAHMSRQNNQPRGYKAWPMHAPRSLPQHSGGVGVLTVLRRQMSIPSPRRPSLSERGAGHSRPSPAATARRLRATDSNVLQLVFIRRPAVPAERHSVGARVAPLPLWR